MKRVLDGAVAVARGSRRRARRNAEPSPLDEVSHGSFPASDPPSSWWGGSGDPQLVRR